ncbi:hydrogen peroxide-inducible genes activator [Litoribrevibacter euphylliae]|uniref:Hydrogen peroxide-inducible genes activator n=1 Tax=Litoribrevibacter euphylliae TaxID=1834034 RepID=A0ABV7HFG9_9GAMM
MTLTELKYLVTLAQELHFGRAASKCFVSQPTLSVAIKKLEDELGVALFERSSGSIRLTEVGEQVVQQSEKVLVETKRVQELAHAGKDQLSGPLKVGAIYTVGPYLFPHLVPEVRRLAPGMPLYIEENYTAVLREKLRRGELDAIFIALPFHEPEVVTQALYDEPFEVLMQAQHPLAKKKSLAIEDLTSEDVMLLGEGHCMRDQILEFCPKLIERNRDTNTRIAEGSSIETLRHMVASGIGITLLPYTATGMTSYSDDVITTRPLTNPQPYRSIALAWRVSFARPKAIDILTQATRQCRVVGAD